MWGLYYQAVPEFAGGDKAKAKEFYEKAIAAGPKLIRNRWIRAKYYQPIAGTRAGFEEDLRWIIAQDPKSDGGEVAWNYYLIQDAKEMLANPEAYF